MRELFPGTFEEGADELLAASSDDVSAESDFQQISKAGSVGENR